MPIQTSPGVAIVEKDFSQTVAFTPTNQGAIAGSFSIGPVLEPTLISSVSDLEQTFGTPNDSNFGVWFTAYNFLQYANALWVTRASPSGMTNASDGITPISISNHNDYLTKSSGALSAAGQWIARTPGSIGKNLEVVTLDAGNYSAFVTAQGTGSYPGVVIRQIPSTTDFVAGNAIGASPTTKNDELVVLVIDKTGKISGAPGTVLEQFEGLSKASDAVNYLNQSIYYVNYINTYSSWIYWGSAPSTNLTTGATVHAWGSTSFDVQTATHTFATFSAVISDLSLTSGGADGSAPTIAELKTAYDTFASTDDFDISFLMTADYGPAISSYVTQSIAEVRRDAIAFISPNGADSVTTIGTPIANNSSLVTNLKTFRNTTLNISSSYAVLDSGFKLQYDGYNKKYRWVPLNGDVAGLCARTDVTSDPWVSPAGYNRGQIKGVLDLSSKLTQAARDTLYPIGINPVISVKGQGTVLFGDKTLQSKASAFDRINVRRLFIILEKAIANASKYQLFELNDTFTRAQFKNIVEPFLRTVQGRRGIDDFMVVCDSSNNTEDVVSRNEFVADIYIKPLYSINYITLNFVATKSSVQFNQVG